MTVHEAIEARLRAAPVRQGLRKRRPRFALVVWVAPLPGEEERLVERLRERSKAADVIGVLGDAAVAVVLDGADEAGARAYVQRVYPELGMTLIAGLATGDAAEDADALLRAAWPAG